MGKCILKFMLKPAQIDGKSVHDAYSILTLIDMRGDTFISLSILNQISSTESLFKKFKSFLATTGLV